jgi:hypothetical protein
LNTKVLYLVQAIDQQGREAAWIGFKRKKIWENATGPTTASVVKMGSYEKEVNSPFGE